MLISVVVGFGLLVNWLTRHMQQMLLNRWSESVRNGAIFFVNSEHDYSALVAYKTQLE